MKQNKIIIIGITKSKMKKKINRIIIETIIKQLLDRICVILTMIRPMM